MTRLLLTILSTMVFTIGIDTAEPENPLEGVAFTASATGVLITRLAPGAQGEQLGLRSGDIITTYANKPITTPGRPDRRHICQHNRGPDHSETWRADRDRHG